VESDRLELRLLTRDQIPTVWTIDRAEIIERIYVLRDAELHLQPDFFDMRGWPRGEPEKDTPLFYATFDRGGTLTGAFDNDTLVGVAIVDTLLVGPRRDLLQLTFLHVSRAYRDRGLGTRLLADARTIALARGARGLYVSATPSEHTIRFYLRMGCRVLAEPDPALFALEPEDIHLEWEVGDGDTVRE
jgi:GNAT superfamily N-acetyltransferase